MSKPRMIGMIKKPMNLKNTGKKKPFEQKKGERSWKAIRGMPVVQSVELSTEKGK